MKYSKDEFGRNYFSKMPDDKRRDSRIRSENLFLQCEVDRLYRILRKKQIQIEKLEKQLEKKNEEVLENTMGVF